MKGTSVSPETQTETSSIALLFEKIRAAVLSLQVIHSLMSEIQSWMLQIAVCMAEKENS